MDTIIFILRLLAACIIVIGMTASLMRPPKSKYILLVIWFILLGAVVGASKAHAEPYLELGMSKQIYGEQVLDDWDGNPLSNNAMIGVATFGYRFRPHYAVDITTEIEHRSGLTRNDDRGNEWLNFKMRIYFP